MICGSCYNSLNMTFVFFPLYQGVEIRYPCDRREWEQVGRVSKCCQTGHRAGGGVKDWYGNACNG